jgi:hypothetical protein
MTLGVPGTAADERLDMVKGGREGIRMAPVMEQAGSKTRKSQFTEWRCLSLREARISWARGEEADEATEAWGKKDAAGDCASWSEEEDILSIICAPTRAAQTIIYVYKEEEEGSWW